MASWRRAIVDAALNASSTDKSFPPEAVERPGLAYEFAGTTTPRTAAGPRIALRRPVDA
jgi:hypothetical protein